MPTLDTTNKDHFLYETDHLLTEVLGGINIERLDSLRATLKIQCKDSKQALRHNLDLYNDIQVGKLTRRAAGKLELGLGVVLDAIEGLTDELEAWRLRQVAASINEQPTEKKLTKKEQQAALNFLKKDNLIARTREAIGASGVIGEEDNALLMYLIFTSRKRANPLHVVSLGASGTGKSHLQEKVAELIPEEDIIEITDLSENAFYYFERNALAHKLILIEDLDGADTAFYPLRELQSKKRITKTVVRKQTNGKTRTETLRVDGPVAVAGCTTRERIYEDNANRSFLIYIDDSKEQDERIMTYQRSVSAGLVDQKAEEEVRGLLQNTQRVLQPIKVVNPYAPYLQIPSEVFKPRRTNNHYLQFIEAVTFYHQRQRAERVNKATGEVYIETTLEDIKIANELLAEVLLRKADLLSGACRKYFEKVKLYMIGQDQKEFTNLSIATGFRLPISTISRYNRELLSVGYLKAYKEKGSRVFNYSIVSYQEYEQLQQSIGTVLDEILKKLLDTTNS